MQKSEEESLACALTTEWRSTAIPIPRGIGVGGCGVGACPPPLCIAHTPHLGQPHRSGDDPSRSNSGRSIVNEAQVQAAIRRLLAERGRGERLEVRGRGLGRGRAAGGGLHGTSKAHTLASSHVLYARARFRLPATPTLLPTLDWTTPPLPPSLPPSPQVHPAAQAAVLRQAAGDSKAYARWINQNVAGEGGGEEGAGEEVRRGGEEGAGEEVRRGGVGVRWGERRSWPGGCGRQQTGEVRGMSGEYRGECHPHRSHVHSPCLPLPSLSMNVIPGPGPAPAPPYSRPAMIGPHGGGLCNIKWLAGGSLVLEFMPRDWLNVHFFEESTGHGLNYWLDVQVGG